MKNYVKLHLHTSFSNLYTTLDSITKYTEYIDYAKQLNMKAITFSEHGNVASWVNKKNYCDENGIKYIHAVEAYVTDNLAKKVRDNYHVLLIAKNYQGVMEINELMSHNKATNRKDGHFYYNPRITSDELFSVSENIIVCSACLGGILNSENESLKARLIEYMSNHSDRCFLEIQHHNNDEQIEYNKMLHELSNKYGIRLVATTDTHSLNSLHALGVSILQTSKDIKYGDFEKDCDLTFKTYDELVEAFEVQNALPREVYMEAIENTNVIADMVEEFELDRSIKYPKIFDDSLTTLKHRIVEGLDFRKNEIKDIPFEVIKERINMELDTMIKIGSVDFILLEDYVKKNARENGAYCGYARGSASGSFICYLLGITDMNSIKFNLNFFRFMNPDRVNLCDIDSDWYEKDKEWVQNFLLTNEKFNSSYIITYNTIALKGAIRDVGRAFKKWENGKYKISDEDIDEISKNVDFKEHYYREKYPKLFEYADIIKGTIVSFGSHPAGIVITDRNLEREIGTITLDGTEHPVSAIDMKEIDGLSYVKLDCLGLDNIGVINKCCKMVGIDRITPDNVDLEDEKVWKSIIEDSTSIFQWESDSAKSFLKTFMSDETLEKVRKIIPNFSMIKWFSYGNGLIRPACKEFRDDVAKGIIYDNGLKEINDFLAPTMGRVAMQEDIMMFLVEFCGYSMSQADVVRRGIAKKKGTEKLLPEIENSFIDFASEKYNISKDKCREVIKPFLQTVQDASEYAFSWNHSDSYSIIGYVLGYLRYYYPLEYLTSSLNVFAGKTEKMTEITYMTNKLGIIINPPKWGYSKGEYFPDKDTNSIYKGIGSIKYLNSHIGDELYNIANNTHFRNFLEVLVILTDQSIIDSRGIEILIKLGYFDCFGKSKYLLDMFNKFKNRYKKTHKDKTKIARLQEIIEYSNTLENVELPLKDIIEAEKEFVGYVSYINKSYNDRTMIATEVKINKWGTPFVTLYKINNGTSTTVKVDKRYFNNKPISQYDLLCVISLDEKFKRRKVNGEWIRLDEKEYVLSSYRRVLDE